MLKFNKKNLIPAFIFLVFVSFINPDIVPDNSRFADELKKLIHDGVNFIQNKP